MDATTAANPADHLEAALNSIEAAAGQLEARGLTIAREAQLAHEAVLELFVAVCREIIVLDFAKLTPGQQAIALARLEQQNRGTAGGGDAR